MLRIAAPENPDENSSELWFFINLFLLLPVRQVQPHFNASCVECFCFRRAFFNDADFSQEKLKGRRNMRILQELLTHYCGKYAH